MATGLNTAYDNTAISAMTPAKSTNSALSNTAIDPTPIAYEVVIAIDAQVEPDPLDIGPGTYQSVALKSGDRFLFYNTTDNLGDGIYVVTGGNPTQGHPEECDTADEVPEYISVQSGTHAGKVFQLLVDGDSTGDAQLINSGAASRLLPQLRGGKVSDAAILPRTL